MGCGVFVGDVTSSTVDTRTLGRRIPVWCVVAPLNSLREF